MSAGWEVEMIFWSRAHVKETAITITITIKFSSFYCGKRERSSKNGHQAEGHDILGQKITLFPSYVANANKRLSVFGFSFLRIEMDYVGPFYREWPERILLSTPPWKNPLLKHFVLLSHSPAILIVAAVKQWEYHSDTWRPESRSATSCVNLGMLFEAPGSQVSSLSSFLLVDLSILILFLVVVLLLIRRGLLALPPGLGLKALLQLLWVVWGREVGAEWGQPASFIDVDQGSQHIGEQGGRCPD